MTIAEAINQADALFPNAYDIRQKTIWLSRCEAMIYREVIQRHEGGEDIEYEEFGPDTPQDHQLIIGQPYDDAYVHWLGAQIHLANQEINNYNTEATMFSASLDGFKSLWKIHHIPLGTKRFLF